MFLGVALGCVAIWFFWPMPRGAFFLQDNMVFVPDGSDEYGKEWWLEVAVNAIGWPVAFAAAAAGALYVITAIVAATPLFNCSKPGAVDHLERDLHGTS